MTKRPQWDCGVAAEWLCLAYASRPSAVTSVVVLQYFTISGPRQRPGMAFSRIMRGGARAGAVPLYGPGAQRRDFTHVGDAVAATIAAASREVRAKVVNVPPSQHPLVQAVRTIAPLAGAEVPSLRRVGAARRAGRARDPCRVRRCARPVCEIGVDAGRGGAAEAAAPHAAGRPRVHRYGLWQAAAATGVQLLWRASATFGLPVLRHPPAGPR